MDNQITVCPMCPDCPDNCPVEAEMGVPDRNVGDTISRQKAIDALEGEIEVIGKANAEAVLKYTKMVCDRIKALPSAQPEVIPHRNYKYLSDYWCECGWHLGKKGEVKYCSECGRKVNWDG